MVIVIPITLAAATKTSFTVCQALTQVVYIQGFFESFKYPELLQIRNVRHQKLPHRLKDAQLLNGAARL